FFFQAEDGIRDFHVTGVQTCALPIYPGQRDGVEGLVGDDVDGAVGAEGEGGAQGLGEALGPDGDGDDLDVVPGLAQADGLLDAVLVHAVHDERDAGQVDPAAVGAHARLGVGDLPHHSQYLHALLQPRPVT